MLVETVRAAASATGEGDLRAGLARFWFRGDVINRRGC